jgi:hypothetical protein
MLSPYVLVMTATLSFLTTLKNVVELAGSLHELVVAVGFVPNSTEQTASVVIITNFVAELNALDCALAPPIATFCDTKGGIGAIWYG